MGRGTERRKHDTSKYGVSAVRSKRVQILGGFFVVVAVVMGLLAINGLSGGL